MKKQLSALTDITGLTQVAFSETLWEYRKAEFKFYYSLTAGQYFLMTLKMQDKCLTFLKDSAALEFLLVLTVYSSDHLPCHQLDALPYTLHAPGSPCGFPSRLQGLWLLPLRAFFFFVLCLQPKEQNPCPKP